MNHCNYEQKKYKHIISFLLHRVYNNDCVGLKFIWKWHKSTIKDKAILQHKLLKIQWHKRRVFLPYQWFNKATFNDFLTTNCHIHDFHNSNLGTKSSTRKHEIHSHAHKAVKMYRHHYITMKSRQSMRKKEKKNK